MFKFSVWSLFDRRQALVACRRCCSPDAGRLRRIYRLRPPKCFMALIGDKGCLCGVARIVHAGHDMKLANKNGSCVVAFACSTYTPRAAVAAVREKVVPEMAQTLTCSHAWSNRRYIVKYVNFLLYKRSK